MTFGSPDTVKKAAEESNIYSGIVDGILDTAAKDAQASTDHAPARWRVNGPLANLPAFGQAHACPARAAMQRAAKDQVSFWC